MKVGIIGAGKNGRGKLEALRQCPQTKSIAVLDPDPDALRTAVECFGATPVRNLESLLEDPEVKLVCISTPNDTHKELTIRALQAGKAVLCEKPMAPTLEEAGEMVDTAERLNGFLQIGFELRYSKLYQAVKEWIEAGLLGQVVNTQCTYILSEGWGRTSWRCRKETGGTMMGEKLSHYVDLPRWWIGSTVRDVYAVSAPNVIDYLELHDNHHLIYRFANGAVSALTFMKAPAATYRGDPLQNPVDLQQDDGHSLRFLIQGTKGAAETDVFRRSLKRWEFGSCEKGFTSDLVEHRTWSAGEDHFQFHNGTDQILDVVRRVASGQPPRTPPRDALETTKLCLAADQSVETGERISL